jgi:glycosidase
MGVDVVWLMPIHPIGAAERKGTEGSPYAIRNYREVNPEYGTKEQFRLLCQYAHALGLKVMIDVVYNHTSPDADLARVHPQWYRRDENGRFHPTVPEWSDIIDLDYDSDPALWDYLIETLKQWVALGVDGFRCDVASAVPIAFWQRARREVAAVNPNVIWLAESVDLGFIHFRRQRGLIAHADAELHTAFDLSYDYDIWPLFAEAVADPTKVLPYLRALWAQKAQLPSHAIKLRAVENHDQSRIMGRARSREQALAWTAFQAFNEGAFLVYGGQEAEAMETPSLFEVDKVRWGGYSLQPFLTRLCQLKKDPAQVDGMFTLLTAVPALSACWQTATGGLYGIFNVADTVDVMPTPLPDGEYVDVLSERPFVVRDGETAVPDAAVVVRYDGWLDFQAHIASY